MSERIGGYRDSAAINWLNDDTLLSIFNCYRLNNNTVWNKRLGWCNLTHVCQRWRHLIYEFTSHLGMYIQCTHGTPIADTLDHLPPLPLLFVYKDFMTEQDELGLYHALQLHNRVREIYLDLPHSVRDDSESILHKCLVLMDGHFPILDRLCLRAMVEQITLPSNMFSAPNLRHLIFFDILPEGLQLLTWLLTSTVSLVTLKLRAIETYFGPTLLVARLSSLPQLELLSISFSIPSPCPRELLGEEGTPITLPNLKNFRFFGDTAYLDFLVSQIMAPSLECLDIPAFDPSALPHLSHFINAAVGLEPHTARVHIYRQEFRILMTYDHSPWPDRRFLLRVDCLRWDLNMDCAAQICTVLISALCSVERLVLELNHCMVLEIGEIGRRTWHELLRPFIGIKALYLCGGFLEELSGALQVDEIGSDPEFLPNLQCIFAADNLFTSFIDTRRVVGRPVQFSLLPPPPPPPPLRYYANVYPSSTNPFADTRWSHVSREQ